ncbi:glycerophosphodiester phosphodiesterase [Fredinandcohnia sp. 179-A 10B2 NHS]|uniref:glycerophosphodiester phosphodiesterase n=1 Tax=Fredinandcohnia sp. 179-A 10B2 NHS TaxID=3235176 RepID=UPI0039A222AF
MFLTKLGTLLLILNMIAEDKQPIVSSHVYTIGHRGAAGYAPENTFAAFDKAIELKADFIELDIQMSKDGELVVIHDSTIDRTTNGSGEVRNLFLHELQKYDAGNWFHPTFRYQRIPTLGQVLDRYSKEVRLLLELKDPELYPGIERRLAKEIKKRHLDQLTDDSIIVQSFNRTSIQKFHRLLPNIPKGVLTITPFTSEQLSQISKYCLYVNPYYPIADQEFIRLLQNHQLKSFVWGVDSLDTFHEVRNLEIHGVITDYPDLVRKAHIYDKFI